MKKQILQSQLQAIVERLTYLTYHVQLIERPEFRCLSLSFTDSVVTRVAMQEILSLGLPFNVVNYRYSLDFTFKY